MIAKKGTRAVRRPVRTHSKTSARNEPMFRMRESLEFGVNQYVLHPSHGVGKIISIESVAIAGETIELLAINFAEDEMTLRVPTAKAASVGIVTLVPFGDSTESELAIQKEAGDIADTTSLAPAARAQPELFVDLLRRGFTEHELFLLVIPKRTLARRRARNELLTVEETDKGMRLMRIATQAERVFGEAGKAHRWLRKSKRELSGQTPLAFLSSETGARAVEEMLHRIEHGIFA